MVRVTLHNLSNVFLTHLCKRYKIANANLNRRLFYTILGLYSNDYTAY